MIVRETRKVKAVEATEGGARGVKMRVMLGEAEGAPNFVLRHFQLESGGQSPRHSHDWEHEVYVLEGEGTVFSGGREDKLEPGKAIFIPPNEEHQFRAAPDSPLDFICVIPIK
jgi:quercetin dioxygenase-like cupin family protein